MLGKLRCLIRRDEEIDAAVLVASTVLLVTAHSLWVMVPALVAFVISLVLYLSGIEPPKEAADQCP